MDTTTILIATGVIVALGKISENRGLSIKYMIAALFIVLGFQVIETVNSDIAKQYAFLILLVVALTYLPKIASKTGISNG